MHRHFDQEISDLKDKLLLMGSHAETAVTKAIRSLVERNDDLAREVEEADNFLDELEMEVDEAAIALLVKAPLGTDLRFITIAMKISQNLERVGDEATTVARRSLELRQEPQVKPYIDIPRMATIGLEMLKEALDGFVQKKPERARAVIPRDKEVDMLNKQLARELSSYMVEKPSTITRCLNLIFISKSLERIADHATNIAEEVVYLYEAKDIRHSGIKQPLQPE
jgi:phosphate transport system protein